MPLSEGGSGNYTYTWTGPGGFQSTAIEPTVTPAQTSTYHLVVDDGFTQFEGDVTVQVNPLPVINLIPTGAHVFGTDTILACVFDTLTLSAASPNGSYLWSNGATSPDIQTATTGIAFDILSYSVDVVNSLTGCENSASITIMFTYGECSYSIEEPGASLKLFVFPNPGKGIYSCRYESPGQPLKLEIFDIQGKLLQNKELPESLNGYAETEINIESAAAGVYLLKVSNDNICKVIRLVKYE
ncbi:MAG: T9SS type A sorting domain-containing protein [Bacteroidales bacterium]|nr:T9SS type A sorting domain-containing protein [Bacteroidales bacterium]